jgi:hypothetical protein
VYILCRILAQSFTDNGNDNDITINDDPLNNSPHHFTPFINQDNISALHKRAFKNSKCYF